MARIVFSREVADDFDRIFDFLAGFDPAAAQRSIAAVVAAIDILETSPQIGRPAERGMRELVIARGRAGYVALYRYHPAYDEVLVLSVRSQNEAHRP